MDHLRHGSTITALLTLLAAALFQPPAMATVMDRLVLSELFYDRQGTDNGFEWVELFNASAAPLDLGDWSLGYGGRDYTTGTLQLSGMIRGGAYFVVGGPSSDVSNGNPVFDQRVDFAPDIQNAGAVADGVALFHTPASALGPHSIPIDALIYGRRNENGLLDELGRAGQVDTGDAPSGQALARSTFTQWRIAASATPGRGPLSLALVHEPMSATLLLAGLLALGMRRPRARAPRDEPTNPAAC